MFGPLNTKESDVLAQNVLSQKWIIIRFETSANELRCTGTIFVFCFCRVQPRYKSHNMLGGS